MNIFLGSLILLGGIAVLAYFSIFLTDDKRCVLQSRFENIKHRQRDFHSK